MFEKKTDEKYFLSISISEISQLIITQTLGGGDPWHSWVPPPQDFTGR